MGIRRSSAHIAFSSEIDLLMYSTFAVQSGESARQQRLALVLPYVLLWSNRAVIHLDRDDSWINRRHRSGWEGPAQKASRFQIGLERTIWIVDAYRDGKRFIVRADEMLTAFLELQRAIHEFAVSLCVLGENVHEN
jgi:hypothetical protein